MMDDDKGGEIINTLTLFPKEMEMYQKYLPAFEDLYKCAGWNIKLAPKCLLNERKGGRINFVFEDLKEKNFRNINRLEGCDMKHMTQVLRRLAELHAVSAVYEDKYGEFPKDFQSGFVDLGPGMKYQKAMFATRVKAYKNAMRHWNLDDVEKYIEKFVGI